LAHFVKSQDGQERIQAISLKKQRPFYRSLVTHDDRRFPYATQDLTLISNIDHDLSVSGTTKLTPELMSEAHGEIRGYCGIERIQCN
jgi:hypothetical protein